MEYKVNEEIAKRIETTKDLNDFYAFMERNGQEYEYDFGDESERIDELMDDINYTCGVYDYENIKRICGTTYITKNDCDYIALTNYEGGKPIDFTKLDMVVNDWLIDKEHSWYCVEDY